jgi:bacterial/archaeal transporter family-2 protein
MIQALIFSLAALGVGAAFSVQGSINGDLGRTLGSPLIAATVSFCVGSIALLGVMLAFGAQPATSLRTLPVYLWLTGGLLGAFIVFTSTALVPRLGIAAVAALIIAGQLATAAVIDHFGLLGVPEHPMNLLRFLGVVLLFAGAVLVRFT